MQNEIINQYNKLSLCLEDSFEGGAIYIDLRNYSKIVEKKPLQNIATIVFEYQEAITQEMKKYFSDEEILTFEYMGDGVLVILKGVNSVDLEYSDNRFAFKMYKNAKFLRDIIVNLLNEKKERYPGLKNLDFGIGLSCSTIYQQTYCSNNNTRKREVFFGKCLNRAAKIGDKMNTCKGNIGIDKKMYNDFLSHYEIQDMIETKSPIVHMHQECKKKLLQDE